MIRARFDATDLLRFMNRLDQKPAQIRSAVADVLNEFGEHSVESMVNNLSNETRINENWIRERITVQRASRNNLEFRIDASRAFSDISEQPLLPGRRDFATMRRPEDYFHQNEMVVVVSAEDEKVCQLCQDMIDDNPYSIEDVRERSRQINPWGNGLWHPNCRCGVVPARSRRELPVQFRRGRGAFVTETVNARELTQRIAREVKVVLQAK